MRDTYAPLSVELRSQPQAASMSTSSQYYRSASAHSHYQNFPNSDHGQLYALPAWQQQPDHASYAGPSPAPFPHFAPGGAESISVSQPASAPHPWSPGYARQEHQLWTPSEDQNFASRSGNPYTAVEGYPSVQQPNLDASRQYQHNQNLTSRPDIASSTPGHTYPSADRFHYPRIASESPANVVDPPFTTHVRDAQPPEPCSHSPSRTSSFHVDNAQRSLPPTAEAPWNGAAGIPPTEHHHYLGHTSNTLVSGAVPSDPSNPSGTSWPIVHSGHIAAGSTLYADAENENPRWPLARAQHDRLMYAHDHDHAHFTQPAVPSLHGQGLRRSSVKKKAAKVPSSFVERQEKLKVSKRKGPLLEKQREKTHTMRKTKRICVRCRFYKSGCDEGDPCEKCQKITGHARSFREPCYREHLEDTSLVRHCSGREHQEEAEFLGYDWVHNSQLYEMEILWNLPGYGPIPNAPPIRVTFRLYSPRRGSLDVATSVWSNKEGEVKAVEQPAYAIYDTANLVPAFERYFSSLQPAIEQWIFARVQQDEIASLTYAEVIRMRNVKGSKALDLAMRLQCLSVVSQGYGSVWSNNIPGIREYDYRRLGSSDYEAYDRKSYDRPLPGAITHQMDVAAVKYLRKIEKAFVKELAALIFKPKIKPWYELFLTFYVIFWNLEYIHHGAHDYIKSKNGTVIEDHVNGVVNTQIQKWEFAFPVLLYHWRCTLRGYSPFKLARENPDELREKGHIDPEGFEFVTKIAHLFDRPEPNRYQPPLTGFATMHYTMSSEWIVKLFKEAGA